ncbi:MAG: hypothetical protein JWM11_5342 [Planctomycetaceae bacterium]|nr:hypothetical protein [Planctomycetaceae bacterium]
MSAPDVTFDAIKSDIALGMLSQSSFYPKLKAAGLKVQLRLPTPARLKEHLIGGRVWQMAQPITFTPFASARPCSARCVFCSETLVHRDSHLLSASLRPRVEYPASLRRALRELRNLPISISLSGLEATDDADWLENVLAALDEHETAGGLIEEKVLYTNGAGLARETTGSRLLPKLQAYGLTRAEVSRHHFDQSINDDIMRFRPGQAIRERMIFERTVRDMQAYVPVRLVCVLQSSGIANAQDVYSYLAWAKELGVRDVVFRELSRLGVEYQPNQTLRVVERDRVVLETLLNELWRTGTPPAGLVPYAVTAGYYFWNLRLRGENGMDVTFETSDYHEMKQHHASDVVYKLIYHANGNLCGDWDPEKQVLLDTCEEMPSNL